MTPHAGCILLAWLALSAAAGGIATSAMERLVLDRMAEADVGDTLPPGWKLRTVRGFTAPGSRVTTEDGHEEIDRAILFKAHGPQAAFFGFEFETALDPATRHLRWHWRVDEAVPGADLRTPAVDDSPARFFVVFGRGGVFSSTRMLFYSWGGSDEIGDHWTYRDDGNVRVMVLRNEASPTGVWLVERRDLRADYLLTFGEEPPPVTGVGFMIDTDQTGASASARLGPIEAYRGS
jgi:hypothetical protein